MKPDYNIGYWKSFEDMIISWNLSQGEMETKEDKIFEYLSDLSKIGQNIIVNFEGALKHPLNGFNKVEKKSHEIRIIKYDYEYTPHIFYLSLTPSRLMINKSEYPFDRYLLLLNAETSSLVSKDEHPELITGKISDLEKEMHVYMPYIADDSKDNYFAALNFYEENSPILFYSKDSIYAKKPEKANEILERYIPPCRRPEK
jgi:hypothetical protein